MSNAQPQPQWAGEVEKAAMALCNMGVAAPSVMGWVACSDEVRDEWRGRARWHLSQIASAVRVEREAAVKAAQRECFKERAATDGGCCKATCKSLSRKIVAAIRAVGA